MDRRTQKTRRAIFDAFDKLITKKAYSKISIQDVIDQANVGRSTFYEHFETKDYLLMEKCTELFEHIFLPDQFEKCHGFSKDSNFNEKITHILYHLLEDKAVVKGILSSESGEIFLSSFRKYLIDIVKDEQVAVDGIPQDFVQNHVSGSFIETVRWWVERDFAESPETVAKYYLKTLKIHSKNER